MAKCLQCNSYSQKDSDYCFWHNPARQQNHQEQYTIETIADVKTIIADTLLELHLWPVTEQKVTLSIK